jgi:hypothetical protein
MPFKVDLLRMGPGGEAVGEERVRAALAGDVKAELQGWRISEQSLDFGSAKPVDVITHIVRAYGAMSGKGDPDVWIDHTPHNIRWTKTLAAEWPDASFIHIIRDGRGVAASLMRLEWGPNSAYRAAHYWLEGLSFGLAAEASLGPRCVRVHYEDLVKEPHATLEKLCDGCGIAFDPAMAEGSGFEVTAYSRGQHEHVGRPPQEDRASAWERELSSREIEIFEAVVSDVLPMLGYESRNGIAATPPDRAERWSAEMRDLFERRVANRLRRRARFKKAGRADE